jgi:hypothetical protein
MSSLVPLSTGPATCGHTKTLATRRGSLWFSVVGALSASVPPRSSVLPPGAGNEEAKKALKPGKKRAKKVEKGYALGLEVAQGHGHAAAVRRDDNDGAVLALEKAQATDSQAPAVAAGPGSLGDARALRNNPNRNLPTRDAPTGLPSVLAPGGATGSAIVRLALTRLGGAPPRRVTGPRPSGARWCVPLLSRRHVTGPRPDTGHTDGLPGCGSPRGGPPDRTSGTTGPWIVWNMAA